MSELVDLRALQLMVEVNNTMEDTRELLTEAVEWFASQEYNDWKVDSILQVLRKFDQYESLTDKDIYFHDADTLLDIDVPEKYKSYSLGIYYNERIPLYAGRLVYPVRDVTGKVMGLCGWAPEAIPKYLDSKTYGYNAKRNCLYGMENLPEYYTSTEPVFFVEGIACCNWLRANGFQSLAFLGSSLSKYVIEILKRFDTRCIILADNDHAGLNVVKSAKYNLPKASCYVSTVAKDIDDTRKAEDGKYIKEICKELGDMKNPFSMHKIFRKLK